MRLDKLSYTLQPKERELAPLRGPLDIKALAETLAQFLNQSVPQLIEKLNKHLGKSSDFAQKPLLADTVSTIQAHLEVSKDSQDRKKAIAEQLIDCIENCGDGFNTRAHAILSDLSCPKNFDQLLARLRHAAVDSSVRSITQDGEVHNLNTYYMYAFKKGYGVHPLNDTDSFSNASHLSDNAKATFCSVFETCHYIPMKIFRDLQINIKAALTTYYGYDGFKEAGYKNGDYDKTFQFLQSILKSDIDYTQVFLIEEEKFLVQNINWPVVITLLWEKLRDENYFVVNDNENQLFTALYSQDDKLNVLLNQEEYQQLLTQLDFINYPELLTHCTETNQNAVIDVLSAKPVQNMDFETFFKHFELIMAFHPDDQAIKKHLKKKLWEDWLSIPEHKKKLIDDLNSYREKMVRKALSACCYLPDGFDPELKRADFTLLTATRYQANAIPFLLSHMETKALSSKIPKIVDYLNYNILMIAAHYQPSSLPYFLKFVEKLDAAEQAKLLSTVSKTSYNALMLAARYQPEAVPHLLKHIIKLNDNEQAKLFKTVDTYGYNALMLAARHQPEAVPHLLKHIIKLNNSEQAKLFNTVDIDGYNALMLAARYQPNALPDLLECIGKFDAAKQGELLCAVENDGYGNNTLMLATYRQPNSLPHLIHHIKKLNEIDQFKIFTAINMNGNNVLAIAHYCHPNWLPALGDAISHLNLSQKLIIYKLVPERNQLLKKEIDKLDTSNAFENALRTHFLSMLISSQKKQIAVLDALNDLRKSAMKNGQTLHSEIEKAIADPGSPFYQALNIKRFSSFFSNDESKSVEIIKAILKKECRQPSPNNPCIAQNMHIKFK